jgi:hypothetical protein
MPEALPPLIQVSEESKALALAELARTLAEVRRELAEVKTALRQVTEACIGLAAELRRGRFGTAERQETPRPAHNPKQF